MTRKGWAGLTVKTEVRDEFIKALKKAKKKNPELDVSTFIGILVKTHKAT